MMYNRKKIRNLMSVVGLSALCVGLSAANTALDRTFVKKSANQMENTVDTFKSEFSSWQDVIDAEAELNKQVGEEGFVLLKNEEKALPLSRTVRNISLFGKNSVNPVYSGSGSSGGTSGNTVSIVDSLKDAGFNLNPTLLSFYEDDTISGPKRNSMGFASYNYNSYFATAETAQSKYTDEVKNSYQKYNDAAVIVLSRTGGEGTDLPRTSYVKAEDEGKVPSPSDARAYPTFEDLADPDHKFKGGEGRTTDPSQHYLELDDNEKDLIREVTSKFDKVVVILNSSNAMELDRELLIDNKKVSSIIFAPGAGQNGFTALGKILNGSVTPSGRLTDTFASDFKKDPTWYNFGNNNVGYYADKTAGNQYRQEDGQMFETNFDDYPGIEEVEYEEGIYLGYKYYETRGYTDGEEWYKNAVNYPFGYGLSYTDFTWEVSDVRVDNGKLNSKSNISVDVKVTNTGLYAGKDVVELYFSAPYEKGKTEKSHVVLGDFAKTKKLRPSESQTLTLSFSGFDMASFDAYDKDGDGHVGYELDAGNYDFYVGKDAHDAWTKGVKKTLTAENENIDIDPTTGKAVKPLFQSSTAEMKDHVLSRADWNGTFPTTPTEDSLCRNDDFLKKFAMPLKEGATAANAVVATWYDEANPDYPEANGNPGHAPWYSATAPSFRSESEAYSKTSPAPIQLKDMQNYAYDDAKWDEFASQLTVNQSYDLMKATRFQFNAEDSIGAPVAGHSDGPVGLTGAWVGGGDSLLKPFAGDHKFSFATETLIGCTWNKDIAKRQGELIGDYGLWAHITGWYAPGGNIHRSPFSGRNFEYYSEDATLSATMMSNVVKGARSKGMVTFMKHFALNDQETNRDTDGVATWADEQTMRENYFKVFEWAVKKGDSNGAMSSFNRIGHVWAGANYALLHDLLREEWGFKGVVITDAHSAGQGCMNANQMIRAGNDMSLDSRENSIARIVNSDEANTPTQLTALHDTVKRIMYTLLHSSGMKNGHFGETVTYTTKKESVEANPGDKVEIDAGDTEENAEYVLMHGKVPAGLRLVGSKLTGTISETAKKGTYTINVAKKIKGADNFLNSAKGGFGISGTSTIQITIGKDGSEVNKPVSVLTVEKIGTIGNVDYYATVLSDGSESYFSVKNGTDGSDGQNGDKGDKGDKGEDGKDGEDSKGGCSGSVIACTSAFAALALGTCALVFRKKRED